MECGNDKKIPSSDSLTQGTRYIGIVKAIVNRYGIYFRPIIRETKERILLLGNKRYKNEKYIDSLYGFKTAGYSKDDDYEGTYFVHISNINGKFIRELRYVVQEDQYVEVYFLKENKETYKEYDFTMIKPL